MRGWGGGEDGGLVSGYQVEPLQHESSNLFFVLDLIFLILDGQMGAKRYNYVPNSRSPSDKKQYNSDLAFVKVYHVIHPGG